MTWFISVYRNEEVAILFARRFYDVGFGGASNC